VAGLRLIAAIFARIAAGTQSSNFISGTPDLRVSRMIPKSGCRFSEKIMHNQETNS
jgi:hypothetical protein